MESFTIIMHQDEQVQTDTNLGKSPKSSLPE